MTTIDKLLNQILNEPDDYAKSRMLPKDFELLTSLNNVANSKNYLTANQGRFILRILTENSKKLEKFTNEIEENCNAPSWQWPFRQIEQVKKLYIEKYVDDEPVLAIEFTHSAEIRKLLAEIFKNIPCLPATSNPKKHHFLLTEKNVVYLVDKLTKHKFEIDETVKNHYDTIKSWNFEDIKNQFLLTTITHSNFQKAITADLGLTTAIDKNIIADRSVRYNYFLEDPKNFGENLTEVIANRGNTKIFIDKNQHTLSEIISSLRDLRRLPIMFVFENLSDLQSLEKLETLSKSLDENGIFEGIGIYFRLPNSEDGKKFNKLIADKKYNARLDKDTKVVVVQSGKIPKFFLKTDWKPMSVVAIDTKMGLRHGKTSVYSKCCDLIIEHSDKPSVLEEKNILVWR